MTDNNGAQQSMTFIGKPFVITLNLRFFLGSRSWLYSAFYVHIPDVNI